MATIKNDYIVFMDDKYVLGMKNGYPFIKINDEKYLLTSNPYEPCLYISKESLSATRSSKEIFWSEIAAQKS